MVTKSRLTELLQNLLRSAERRNTEQGTTTYRHVLENIEDLNSNDALRSQMAILNRALAGIEAHGYFTNEEHEWVNELQEIEKGLK